MCFIILTCASVILIQSAFAGCKFSLNGDIPVTPIILKNLSKPAFLYPDDYNYINIPEGGLMKLQCRDKMFKKFKTKMLRATCLHDNIVKTKSQELHLKELECEDFPASQSKKTPHVCYGNKTLVEIGFQLGVKFLKTITVCFDVVQATVLYSWYDYPTVHLGHQYGVRRPRFTDNGLHNFEVDRKYTRKNQQETFAKLLKSKSLARRYVRNDNLYFLARGHLTPKADFLYGSEQVSSYHYVNVAPQWQIFNSGNWAKLENDVREFLLRNRHNYSVITGTYGISTLPDINEEQQELYLHVEGNEKRLPVPNLFWKILYHKQSETGVAVIGINNPHLKEIPRNYILCDDICSKVKWLKIKLRQEIRRGYLYCCDMDAFLNATGFENVFKIVEGRCGVLNPQIDRKAGKKLVNLTKLAKNSERKTVMPP